MCPRCGSMRVHHSRPRGAVERVGMRVFPVAYYRCHDCGWRSWLLLRSFDDFALYVLTLFAFLTVFAIGAALVAGVVRLMK